MTPPAREYVEICLQIKSGSHLHLCSVRAGGVGLEDAIAVLQCKDLVPCCIEHALKSNICDTY